MDTNDGLAVEPAFVDRSLKAAKAALEFGEDEIPVHPPLQPKAARVARLEGGSDVPLNRGKRVGLGCPLTEEENPVEPRFAGSLFLCDVRSLVDEGCALAEKRAKFLCLQAEPPLRTHLAEPEEREVNREGSTTGPLSTVFRNTGGKGTRKREPVEGKTTADRLAHHEATCDERVEIVSGVLAEKCRERRAKRYAVASDVSEDPLAPLASAVA